MPPLDEEEDAPDSEDMPKGEVDEGELAAATALKDALRDGDNEGIARALADFCDAHGGADREEAPPEKGKGLLALIGMKPKK